MKTRYLFIAFSILCSVAVGAHESDRNQAGKIISGDSIYNLSSKWTNQDGKSEPLTELRGKFVILTMAYTSCEHACPLLVSDMKKIEQKLGEPLRNKVQFVVCSFDTDRDTPTQLKAYAKKRGLDPTLWTLFNGGGKSVRELAAVLGIKYVKDENGDFDHSNVITLLDRDGLIVLQQNGLNNDGGEIVNRLKKLQ